MTERVLCLRATMGLDMSTINSANGSPIPACDLRVPVFFTVIVPPMSWPKWRAPLSGFLRVSNKGIIVSACIEKLARWDEMHFSPYFSSGFRQLLQTWVCLALRRSIPLSRHNIEWIQSEEDRPYLLISPCWPADFSVHIWFLNQNDIEATLLAIEHMWAKGVSIG